MPSKIETNISLEPAQNKVLKGLLTIDRVRYGVAISSKKRLLEELAALLSRKSISLDKHTVCRILTERERLGSTSIGEGVALPHGRLNGISECIAAVIQLKKPLTLDALDEKPICLAIALLVPANASKQHLEILAGLATLFNETKCRELILKAQDSIDLFKLLT